jgi:hypothetical protein
MPAVATVVLIAMNAPVEKVKHSPHARAQAQVMGDDYQCLALVHQPLE